MNIREFAARCGISATAASRILNRSREESHASRATYERIRKKAVELGYDPNYAAKTLHTHRSNCLGVILAGPGSLTTLSIMHGVTDCAYRHGVSLAAAMCENDPGREAEAFDNMLSRGVDAIIWSPTLQRNPRANSHVGRLLKKYTRRIPVFCLAGHIPHVPADIFKFHTNCAADAAGAARRQLALGCGRFGIFWDVATLPSMLESVHSYRSTLLERGIAEENITDFIMNDPEHAPPWEEFRSVQGVWIHLTCALRTLLAQMRSVRDLKQLHVDGQILLDEYAFSLWNNIPRPSGTCFPDLFGSVRHHIIDFEKCAYRATEILLQAMSDPSLKPFDEPVEWQLASPDYVPPDEFFHW